MVFDLSDTKSILNAAELILKHSGHVDILINNAGISYRGTIIDTGLDVDKKVMETNYFGPIALTKGTWDSRYRGTVAGTFCRPPQLSTAHILFVTVFGTEQYEGRRVLFYGQA